MSNPKPVDSDQRAAHKGQQTKATIVEAALGLATQIGLEGLSIGALAEVARLIEPQARSWKQIGELADPKLRSA